MRSTPKRRCRGVGLIATALGAVLILGASGCTVEETLNPCAANTINPCAANPCNPCGANPCNPCSENPCNPCASNPCGENPCNPCGANPCNPCGGGGAKASDFTQPEGQRIAKATPALVSLGEELWNDKSLSSNGLACQTCHVGGSQMNASFAEPYPHRVAMVHQQSGRRRRGSWLGSRHQLGPADHEPPAARGGRAWSKR